MSVISPIDTDAFPGRGASTTAPRPEGQPDGRGPDHEWVESSGPEVVPARAPGLELLGELPGSGYRQPPGLVRRADGQTCQLSRLLYLILETTDGRRTYAQIAAELTRRTSRLVSADNVRMLAEVKLRPLGLLRSADGSSPIAPKSNPLLALRFRFVVSNPRVTRRITAPFAVLFRPLVVAIILAAFLASAGWVLFDKGLASATYQAFDEPGLLLLVFAITVVSAGFHEFGHAAACRYGGATPGTRASGSTWSGRPSTPTSTTATGSDELVGSGSTSAACTSTRSSPSRCSPCGPRRAGTRSCSSSRPRCCRCSANWHRSYASTATTSSPI
ncbi:hypothetical protein [Micromonospora sp. A200]|uniref:hypothetical protein n=1 Tax=Micromonospora sp. A200 TaxID=2940568 RepID=UPI0024757B25|nr:hypothetical protein [Micromonospora sp. A200]